jgi:hypothetical protein
VIDCSLGGVIGVLSTCRRLTVPFALLLLLVEVAAWYGRLHFFFYSLKLLLGSLAFELASVAFLRGWLVIAMELKVNLFLKLFSSCSFHTLSFQFNN